MPSHSEIASLINLLEDPDPQVHLPVMEHMVRLGEAAVPLIDGFRNDLRHTPTAQTLGSILHRITFSGLEQEFLHLLDLGLDTVFDLEKACLLLCRVGDPTLRTELYSRRLSGMSSALWHDLHGVMSPVDEMRTTVDFIFVKAGFAAPESDELRSANSYLNRVLDTRRGLPLSLAVVALLVSARLDGTLMGINFPYHFLLGHEMDGKTCYIDPHQSHRLLTRADCDQFLMMNGLQPDDAYYRQATPADMLARTMRNLLAAYQAEGDTLRHESVNLLLGHLMVYLLKEE